MGVRAIIVAFILVFVLLNTFSSVYFGSLAYIVMGFVRPERLTYGQAAVFKPYLLLYLAVFISFFLRKKQNVLVKYNRSFYMLGLIVLFSYISSYGAAWDSALSFHWASNLLKIFIFSWVLRIVVIERGNVYGVLGAILVGGCFIALWSFEQHFRGNVRLEAVGGGNFNDSNSVAMLMVQIVPILLYVTFFASPLSKKGLLRLMYGVLAVVSIGVIIFTESRAGMLGCVIGMFFLWLGFSARYKFLSFLVVLLILPLVFMATNRIEGYGERMQIEKMQEDTGGREALWRAAYSAFADRPLTGVGQQNFKYLAKNYALANGEDNLWFNIADAHNTFFLYAAEGGLGQCTAFILLFFFAWRDCSNLFRGAEGNYTEQYFYRALMASVAGLAVTNFFHSYPAHENILIFLLIPECIRNIKYNEQNIQAVN